MCVYIYIYQTIVSHKIYAMILKNHHFFLNPTSFAELKPKQYLLNIYV